MNKTKVEVIGVGVLLMLLLAYGIGYKAPASITTTIACTASSQCSGQAAYQGADTRFSGAVLTDGTCYNGKCSYYSCVSGCTPAVCEWAQCATTTTQPLFGGQCTYGDSQFQIFRCDNRLLYYAKRTCSIGSIWGSWVEPTGFDESPYSCASGKICKLTTATYALRSDMVNANCIVPAPQCTDGAREMRVDSCSGSTISYSARDCIGGKWMDWMQSSFALTCQCDPAKVGQYITSMFDACKPTPSTTTTTISIAECFHTGKQYEILTCSGDKYETRYETCTNGKIIDNGYKNVYCDAGGTCRTSKVGRTYDDTASIVATCLYPEPTVTTQTTQTTQTTGTTGTTGTTNPNQQHLACLNDKCVIVSGAGESTCHVDGECQGGQCTTAADCIIPPGGCAIPKCIEGKCQYAIGECWPTTTIPVTTTTTTLPECPFGDFRYPADQPCSSILYIPAIIIVFGAIAFLISAALWPQGTGRFLAKTLKMGDYAPKKGGKK